MSRNFERLMQGRDNKKYLYDDMGTFLMHKSDVSKMFKMLLDDECFNDFIAQLEKDGNDLNNRNEQAKLEKDPQALKGRDEINQFIVLPNRKEVAERENERDYEYRIYKKYKDDAHDVLGKCKKYQVPVARECSGADIDLVFSNKNRVYMCELKKKPESIFRAISEILTYYFCVYNRKEYFIKAFIDENSDVNNSKIIPCIIIPNMLVKDIIVNAKTLKNKLKEKDIELEIFYYSKVDEINQL